METLETTRDKLPDGCKLSSTFGNPGDGGYFEYWRAPDGSRWQIANGPYHLHPFEFDWHCQEIIP